jgi:hypothetical protein
VRRQPSKQQLRCFCSRKPLLAIWGNDENGRPYIHVRIYKQGRIFGDVVAHGGEVKICCRECVRWHRIVFVGEQSNKAKLEQTAVPEEIDKESETPETDSDEG